MQSEPLRSIFLSRFRKVWLGLFVLALAGVPIFPGRAWSAEESPTFNIQTFVVDGNTLLTEKAVQDILQPYMGPSKTAADVEKARDALEKLYHDQGYPAVLVNLPEQTVEEDTIHFQVIESKIGNVRVSGNRYYTREKILRDLPSLSSGKILYVPDVQKDLEWINRGQDLKASPVLSPGKELGLTDVDVKVEDKLPLHGNLELNNYNTPGTDDLRLNAMIRYDNLWQRDHSISAQFQTSPQNTGEVKLYAGSYTLPAPWMKDHQIAFYAIKSDSNTTSAGQGFLVTGKGSIVGMRYVIPLAPYGAYAHNITIGLDYKDFQETTGPNGTIQTPVKYLPLSLSYSSSVPDAWGVTRFSSLLNVAFRGLVTDQSQFEVKRFGAEGNYMYVTAGVERQQKLPAGMSFFLKLDGQIADQPLINNEQYIAGGVTNVRGYLLAATLGDDAVHGTAELSGPDLGPRLGLGSRLQCTPYIFYDYAWVKVTQPLPSQTETTRLQGTGVGLRGNLYRYMYFEADLAFPLSSTRQTEKNEQQFYFKLGAQF